MILYKRSSNTIRIPQYLTKFHIFLFSLQLLTCKSSDGNELKLVQQNAVWSESKYLRGYQPSTKEILTDDEIKNYAQLLKTHNIKYAYLFAGPFNRTGHLPSYAFSQTAIKSVARIKEIYPKLVILPWIGGIQNGTVHLEDSSWVNNALADTKKLIDTLNVPGVHLDFEFILAGNIFLDTTIDKESPGDRDAYPKNVNLFHKKLRKLLPKSFVSAVVGCTAQNVNQWKRKTTLKELQSLIPYIDQLSFLFYDTSIKTQSQFEKACSDQLDHISQLQKTNLNPSAQYLVAIGTFVNREELQKYRILTIENIENTLKTLKKINSLRSPSDRDLDGIAIFCDWETDKSEWYQIYENWTNGK